MRTKFTIILVLLFWAMQIQAQVIEVLGTGVFQQDEKELTITNTDNVQKVVVEAIFKASAYVDGPVKFNDLEADANFNIADYNPMAPNPQVAYFTATFDDIIPDKIKLYQLNNLGKIHSFIAYVYRSLPAEDYTSIIYQGSEEHAFLYRNGRVGDNCYNSYPKPVEPPMGEYIAEFTIPEDDEARDVIIYVPISELANDTRNGWVEVTDGQQAPVLYEFITPNLGNSFHLASITLLDVAGDVTTVTVKIWSPCVGSFGNGGDSFITSAVVVNVEKTDDPPGEYCTLTQGFYGNPGGKYMGYDTPELLEMLLDNNPLVIGLGGDDNYSFTIETPECVLYRLPGGGPSKALTADDDDCTNEGYKTHNDGRIKNNLLAQTITLGLNLRLEENNGMLDDLELENLPFFDFSEFTSSGVITIGDLYLIANVALSGTATGFNLGDITDGIGAFNDYFDECVSFDPNAKQTMGLYTHVAKESMNLSIYPNPVDTYSSIEFEPAQTGYTRVDVYNMMGSKVSNLYSGHAEKNQTYSFAFDATQLQPGIYILFIQNGESQETMKFKVH